MGIISFRTYLGIAVLFALVFAGLGYAFGEDIYSWAARQDAKSARAGIEWMGTLVMEPVKFTFDPDLWPGGAIVAGLLWPFAILWMFMILVHMVAVEAVGVSQETDLPG